MRRYLVWAAPLALCVMHGCGSDQASGEPGILTMDLRTEAAGSVYRLRAAVFDVRGPEEGMLSSEDEPDATSIQRVLDAGDYDIHLRDGWRLERQAPAAPAFETVVAELVSPNPAAFSIAAAQTTHVVYTFETDGTLLAFGEGTLDLSIAVRVTPACDVGSARCDDNRLQLCAEDGSGFVTVETCNTAALCDPEPVAHCIAPACVPGQRRCNGVQAERCNPDRTGFDLLEVCASAASCDPLLGVCRACVPGERRCDGNVLEVCAPNGAAFQLAQVCGSAAACDPSVGACLPSQ